MFCRALFLNLTLLVFSSFAAELSVSLSAVSSSVKSIEDIVLTAVVTNPSDEAVQFIKFNTVLDDLPTQSFIARKDGAVVAFKGIVASIAPEVEGASVSIPAGRSVAVNHTIGSLFDFESAGTGKFTFEPSQSFEVVGASQRITFNSPTVEVEVTEDVANRQPIDAQLSTPSCGDGGRNSVIATSLTEARAMAGGAASDLRTHPSSGAWNAYFGGTNANAVWYTFDMIAGDLASSGTRRLYCQDDGYCATPGIVAYTLLVTSGGNIVGSDIYYCPYFFNNLGPTQAICSGASFESTRSGVTLHELAHAVSIRKDTRYGCSGSQSLSPAEKEDNADNYRCYAAQIYRDYNC